MELADYRESSAFSDLEKCVLDYAVALSQTPADARIDSGGITGMR